MNLFVWIVIIPAVVVLSYFFVQASGYAIHRSLHWKFSGRANRAHSQHHTVLYDTEDHYLTDRYMAPPWYDLPFFYYAPAALLTLAVVYFLFPWFVVIILAIMLVVLGLANDYIHVAIHTKGHFLEKYAWFKTARKRHWQHHLDETTNYGIFTWETDRLFGTFVEPGGTPPYERGELKS